jgi:catechol 2,3-dioxygenase-like lactoylglutathione lyase family enzyme
MTIQQMHHVSIVVNDLEAAKAFFVELGMDLEGQAPIEGPWVDRVNDLDATVAALRAHGATLIGEVAQYQDSYRLCYVRGPEGIIVALAEQLT